MLVTFVGIVFVRFVDIVFVTFVDTLFMAFIISSHTITESSAILFKYLLFSHNYYARIPTLIFFACMIPQEDEGRHFY